MYHINKEITASGENIALKNTARHYFKSFDILGNSVQEGTPSIDSEAPIESVGDNINLIGIQDGSWTENGLTVNVKNNKININGTVTASSNVFFTLKESLNLNGKYSFQVGNNIALTGGEYFRLYTGTTGFDVLVAFGALTSLNVKSENINISGRADRLAIRVNAGTVFNNVTFEPKLEKGTKATPYSPYGQGSIEIKQVNKNQLKVTATTKTENGITFTVNKDGTVLVNGTATANTNFTVAQNIKLNDGEGYTLNGCPTGGSDTKYAVTMNQYYSNTSHFIQDYGNGASFIYNKLSANSNSIYIRIISGAKFDNLIFEPMIRLATNDDTYVEHQSQIKALYTQQPFRAIGDVKDRFVKLDGVWYEEHNIDKIIFNGTEYWEKRGSLGDDYSRFGRTLSYGKDTIGFCDKLTVVSNANWSSQEEKVDIDDTMISITVKRERLDTDDVVGFKNLLLSNNITIYVKSKEPLLIPCTPEQVEVLEYFEKEAYSYDEVTHIYSTDEVSPYFEITAYQRISEEFKTRLKEGKITRGYLKVLATDTLPEIIIDENNYLKDLKIEELRYVPEEGIIGGTVAKRVSGNFNNVDSSFDIQDREIEVYLGVELEDETTEYIKYGTYIVQRPEDDQVNDNTSFEALDYMIKFNQEYKDRITYPCTLKQLLDDIVDQAGVNSKVATFANSDFIVENNQFEQGSTLRDVLKAITQVAFNWSRIDADDNLVMDFEIREETDEELGTDDYFSFKKSDDYGPVNVVVLRNSQVEGENVTIKDEESIAEYGETELVISDNPFAYTELKRKQLIEAGKRLFGFKYTPMTVDMLGLMYLNAKDRISVENLNGQKYSTYLFDHTIDYTGIVLDSMESKAKTKTETKYQYISSLAQGLSHVEIKVDKANKRIESIIESQEDVSEKVAKTVARIEVVYALSDSPTTAPTDGWSTTAPEWTAGKYMWQKTITTYANGTTAETAATNISGAKGEAGKNGIGITQTNITYQKSTSGTTVPTGTWQTTIPEVDEDGYLWTRTEFIYSDGSKKYAYNVGKKGATGIGVKSIIDQYYSSTSSTELAGGEWKETQDTLQTDRFIWTRSKITWTNGSVTYTDPILANTLNDINSNIIVFKDFKATQESTNKGIESKVEETTKKLNDEYLTADKVNEKIDKIDDDYTILESRVAQTELDSKSFKISIETIQNTGVDKIKTSMGYTFNDEGLKIDRPGADTSTIIDEAKIKVTDKTGSEPKSLLYAGYVKEGDTEFSDYEGQTIVATSNLIVQNFLIIGSNSRFQDYYNETLGGNGTGAFDI